MMYERITTFHWALVLAPVYLLPDPFRMIAGVLVLILYIRSMGHPVIE